MDIDAGRENFGRVLRCLRAAAGLSQEELAERAHLSVESVSALERGRRKSPYRETVRMLADALDLSDAARRELEAAARRPRSSAAHVLSYDSADQAPPIDQTRRHLVRPLSTFLNRTRDLDDLAALLANYRIVSIVGAGGIGKTRVAIELGWRLADRYRDGIWFVDLAPLGDESVVARSIVTTLDIPVADGQVAADALVHHLDRRDALLIIDNCEHVVSQVAALLDAVMPPCGHLRVLATSREPLHIEGERVYRLPPLESPTATWDRSAKESLEFPAVALFVDRASAANAGFAYTDAAAGPSVDICRRLDGIALAIELAASRTAVLSPRQILVALEEHFDVLGGGRRTALPRQQTMREAIRWSYDRLSAPERSLFRRVALFAGGWTWELLSRLPGAGEAETFDMLAALADKSLVVADVGQTATRYRLLEPMRSYGLTLLEEAGELDAGRTHFAAWCLDLAQDAHHAWATRPSDQWHARFEPELDNLRAGLMWTLDERNDVALGQRIVAASRRLWARLLPAEGRRWVDVARRGVDARTDAEVLAALDLAEAHLDTVLGHYVTALRASERCAPALAASGKVLEAAEAGGFAGFALARLDQSERGEALVRSSVEIFGNLGAEQLAAYAVSDLGIAHSNRGDVVAAGELFRQARSMFRAVGNERAGGGVAANLAEIEFRAGNVVAAVRLCEEAVAAGSQSGRETQMYLGNLAAYLITLGRYGEAREKARESVAAGGMARTEINIAFALQHLATIAALQTRPDENEQEHLRRAAGVTGFVDSRLEMFGVTREYTEQQEYEQLVRALRQRLGAHVFTEVWQRGRSWSEDEALSEAFRL
jgi:predicted ATPase/DNA-binding XRE family transcriptional regulator